MANQGYHMGKPSVYGSRSNLELVVKAPDLVAYGKREGLINRHEQLALKPAEAAKLLASGVISFAPGLSELEIDRILEERKKNGQVD
jgi:hypothetical protein